MGLAISSVDGKNLGKGLWGVRCPSGVRLTPGRHKIGVTYRTPMSGANSDLWLDTEAGKAYSLRMRMENNGGLHIWIAETDTGVVVGGIDNGHVGPPVAASVAASTTPTELQAQQPLPVADATSALLICDPDTRGRANLNYVYAQSHFKIYRVDGVRQFHMGSSYQVVKLTPGHHKINLRYEAGHGGLMSNDQELDAEAGKTYVANEQLQGYASKFWIERADTGEVVSGTRPKVDTPPLPGAPAAKT